MYTYKLILVIITKFIRFIDYIQTEKDQVKIKKNVSIHPKAFSYNSAIQLKILGKHNFFLLLL